MDDLKRSRAFQWLQSNFFALLQVSALLIAILLIAIEQVVPHELAPYIGHVATAIITAVILGASLDWVFHQRLLEDAFKASIGYILPEDLKEEVRALYEAPFVCVEHIQDSEILPIPNRTDLVALHSRIQRTFRNVTSSKREFAVNVSLTEWLVDTAYRSRILDLGCIVGEERFSERTDPESVPGLNKFTERLKGPVQIAPGETLTVWHETIETKRSTDIAYFVFEHPTRDPLVNFRVVPAAQNLIANIRFNSRNYANREQLGAGSLRMRGTLNPFQSIELRWFTRSSYEEWQADNALGEGESPG